MKDNSIALIECSGKKHISNMLLPASIRYKGTLFKLSVLFATRFCGGRYFILSAKFGLLSPTDLIPYYDLSLHDINKCQRKEWAEKVSQSLSLLQISHIYIYLQARFIIPNYCPYFLALIHWFLKIVKQEPELEVFYNIYVL